MKEVEIQFFSGAWNSPSDPCTYHYSPYCKDIGSNYYDAYSLSISGRISHLTVRGVCNHFKG